MSIFLNKGHLNKLMTSLMVAAMFAAAFFVTNPTAKAADATGTVTITGGGLTFTADDVTFPSVVVGETTSPADLVIHVSDLRGTGEGWILSLTATDMTGATHTSSTIPNGNQTTGAVTANPTSGVAPDGLASAGANLGSSVTLVQVATKDTGTGQNDITVPLTIAVPNTAFAETYTGSYTLDLITAGL